MVQVPVAGSYSSALARSAAVITACDKHLAVGQQRRRVRRACRDQAAGGGPGPGGRIVQFRARESDAAVMTVSDQHLAVGSNVAV